MKTAAILLCIFCTLSLARAQNFHFTDTGNVWKVLEPEYDASGPFILHYYTFAYAGVFLEFTRTKPLFRIKPSESIFKNVLLLSYRSEAERDFS